jgi:hypothetical protein
MSINYYARETDTPADEDGLHVGLHNAGAEFLFRAHPDKGLTDCTAWLNFLSRPGVEIVTEYGAAEPLKTFWDSAMQRSAADGSGLRLRFPGDHRRRGESLDSHGHPFLDEDFC